jgi:hypothetical protein
MNEQNTPPIPLPVPPPPSSSTPNHQTQKDDSGKFLVYTCIGACILMPIAIFVIGMIISYVAINPVQRIRETEERRIQSEERQAEEEVRKASESAAPSE